MFGTLSGLVALQGNVKSGLRKQLESQTHEGGSVGTTQEHVCYLKSQHEASMLQTPEAHCLDRPYIF